MAIVRYPIKLNVKPSPYPLIKSIALVQGDTANVFAIELQEDKQPFNIEDCYVTATFKKADDNVVILEGEIIDATNGLVDIPIYLQAVSCVGKTYCTIEVYNNNDLRLTSIMFEFDVVEQLGHGEDIESVTEYTILQELIADVQSIKIEEEQRVINENTRIQNEIDRQTVFDGIVNTANTTKDGLDSSIINADMAKANLDDSITTGTKLNDNLTNVINNGDELTNTLPPLIENANTSKTNLDTSINNADNAKTNLDDSINLATSKKTLLDTSISDGTALNADLDSNISTANIINDILSDATDGTIKIATEIDNELKNTINTANTSKGDLDAVINTANTSKINLDDSISTANTVKFDLDESITTGTSVREDLEQIIAGTDFEQVIIDLDYMKNQINEPKYLTTISYDNIISLPEGSVNGQVGVSVKGLTVSSLLGTDGDFSSGTDKLANGWEISNSSLPHSYNEIEKSQSFSMPYHDNYLYYNLNINNGHKYFIRFLLKKTIEEESKLVIGFENTAGAMLKNYTTITSDMYNIETYTEINKILLPKADYSFIGFSGINGIKCNAKIKDMTLVDLTELFGAGNEPTVEQCKQMFDGHVSGTKSTFSAMRLKSVGKNLLSTQDIDKYGYTVGYNSGTNWISNSTRKYQVLDNGIRIISNDTLNRAVRFYKTIKLEVGKTYTVNTIRSLVGFIRVYGVPIKNYTGSNELHYYGDSYISTTFTVLGGYEYIQVAFYTDRVATFDFTNIQLEEGAVVTPYEPYTESTSYLPNVGELRSLPNGTKDEIRVSGNKAELVKRVSDDTLITMDMVGNVNDELVNVYRMSLKANTFQNIKLPPTSATLRLMTGSNMLYKYNWSADEESFYVNTDYNIVIKVLKATIDNMNGSTLIEKFKTWIINNQPTLTYQLAEPEIIPIRWTGLQGYKDGTVYFDTIIPEVGMYYNDCLETNYPDHPILSIDSLYKVDKENGLRVALDVTKCVISEDGLSFTHPDLVNGDLCDWDYVPITETTQGEKTIISTGNLNSIVDGLLVENRIQKENIREINSRVDHNCNELLSKANIVDIPTQISQLDNDVGYVTQDDVGQIVTSDVLEFESKTAFPSVGEKGKVYIAVDTNLMYRWGRDEYVEISSPVQLGETSTTAYRGDRGKTAYDHSQSTHARVDATKVENSTTNGNIKINGTETNVYTHPANHDDRYYTETEIDTKLSDKVDNSRVLTDVPANAKFTDTTYSEITESEIDGGSSSTLRAVTGRRIKYILDKVQSWINGLTKSDIGLSNVDNTSDLDKPISTATQAALDSKVDNSRVLTDVPANAKFTDTITPINNTLTSTSTTQALSANQGNVLDNKIDNLTTDVVLHKEKKATQSGYGHIRLQDIPTPTKESIGLGNVDNVKQMPISGGVLENYREKLITLSGTAPTINLNNGNVFTHSLTGNTTYSISNAVNGQAHSFTLIINMGSTVRTLTFPASVKWQGGKIPNLTTANKTYVLTFFTINGGTTWFGMFGGEF